jgi:hypothetical protein
MATRKMRVEVFDGEGNKYTVAFEGQISREKAIRLLDLVELLGGVPSDGGSQPTSNDDVSKYEKVRALIRKHFPLVWFSSRDIQPAYEQEYEEIIGLSTVGTYLARMTNKGFLVKAGSSKSLKYKLAVSLPQATLKNRIP